ncbi:MAG TPA: MBL fold metallo-hydrolase [Verrucomicrobiae bacterium]|jgi:cyclase|nr:MBL fold metallo-hydrolase [Verrucomicrobiae bacterium]
MKEVHAGDRVRNRASAFSRRSFLANASSFGAFYAAAQLIPLPALGAEFAADSRVSQTPIADKGFASVRKVGEGLYATISDPSKGMQTLCNGGFLVGKDSALLLEGYMSPAGPAFQIEALRMVSQVPVKGALDTHYHVDHTMGNAYYGANGIPLWAHAGVAKRMVTEYGALQGKEKAAVLAPYEKSVGEAKTELGKKHAQEWVAIAGRLYDMSNSAVLALPNHPIDPAALPMKIDLGGLTAMVEGYPGHSGTDLLVRVPEQNVVYAGDLLFSGAYPVMFDSQATVSGWMATLKTFASWDKDTLFVPGHGTLCGQDWIAKFREVFNDIVEQAEKLHKAGVPASEAADQYVVPEEFKGVALSAYTFTVGPAITKLYAEWDAK